MRLGHDRDLDRAAATHKYPGHHQKERATVARRGCVPHAACRMPRAVEPQPKAGYYFVMTRDQLAELEKRIEEETVATQKSIPYLTAESVPVEPSVALGRLTRMEALNDKGVNEEMLRQAQRRLERLNNAAERMQKGWYGACIRCKQEIAFERLKAIPEALMCISCADRSLRQNER